MSGQPMGDGKRFLEGLILRAEDVLAKMIYKLHRTNVPLEEMVPWINSVYGFVNSWEESLKDVSIDALKRAAAAAAAASPGSGNKSEEALMEEINNYGSSSKQTTGEDAWEARSQQAGKSKRNPVRTEEAEPVFEYVEQSLKDYTQGQTGIGFITSVVPNSTYFYMLDRTREGEKVDQMLKTLQNVTARLMDLPSSSSVVFGLEQHGEIFRAIRSKSDPSFPFLKLLDTGEIMPFVDRMILYQLPTYYQNFPPFAVRCQLVNVVNESFFCDLQHYLKENMYVNKTYEVCRVDSAVLHVKLAATQEKKISLHKLPKNEQAIPDYKISENTLTQEERAILYEEPESTTNAMKATMGFVPQDDRRICPFYDPTREGCFKGTSCRLEHVAKDPDGWTRDRALHKVKIQARQMEPRIGSEHEIIPTAIISVQEFYGQLVTPGCGPALAALQMKLNEPKNVRAYRKMDHEPYTREYVFAQYQGEWFRAEVMEYYDDRSILVFYVDYGNYEQVEIDDLRLWDDRFDYLPLQAIHCRLANVLQANGNDVKAATALRIAICDKRVRVKVLDIRAYWEVLVYNEQGADVGRMLVDRKLALPRKPIVINGTKGFVPA
ncbi:uncharacterized protein LOC131690695 isoform X2 [Topomyia yanbarensis]|uniref:uncharacterized protein LOC131690695 isoform X2 n=1 Tax=Topomyia yanbarensis TaxID=2498891 RepID=UPI00273CB175|nr:uncharacterized protein LOC131690695 isoform X2 [Topomyia yanbarensis]